MATTKISPPYVHRKSDLQTFFGAGSITVREQVTAIEDWSGRSRITPYTRRVTLPAGAARSQTGHIVQDDEKIAPLYAYTTSDGRRFVEYVQERTCDHWGVAIFLIALKHGCNGKPVKSTTWTHDEVTDLEVGG